MSCDRWPTYPLRINNILVILAMLGLYMSCLICGHVMSPIFRQCKLEQAFPEQSWAKEVSRQGHLKGQLFRR